MEHSSKKNEAGEMYITTGEGTTLYDIFTRAGFYRGGKSYFADKVVRILSGSAEIISHRDGFDIHETLTAQDGEKIIISGVPHIFYFPEDCRMLEWFPEGTKTENFEAYRNLKNTSPIHTKI